MVEILIWRCIVKQINIDACWISEDQKQILLRDLFYPRANYQKKFGPLGYEYQGESMSGKTSLRMYDDDCFGYFFTATIWPDCISSLPGAMHVVVESALKRLGVDYTISQF